MRWFPLNGPSFPRGRASERAYSLFPPLRLYFYSHKSRALQTPNLKRGSEQPCLSPSLSSASVATQTPSLKFAIIARSIRRSARAANCRSSAAGRIGSKSLHFSSSAQYTSKYPRTEQIFASECTDKAMYELCAWPGLFVTSSPLEDLFAKFRLGRATDRPIEGKGHYQICKPCSVVRSFPQPFPQSARPSCLALLCRVSIKSNRKL